MKQRLVGALVLLSGGVVLWSLLFTGPAAYKVSRSSQIPPPPVIEPVDDIVPHKPANIPPPQPLQVAEDDLQPLDAEPENSADAPAVKEQAVVATAAADTPDSAAMEKASSAEKPKAIQAKTEPAKPSLQAETQIPKGWVLQVASFIKKPNAEKLKEQLQAEKYKAYVQKVSVASGDRYRVMVGPSLNKADAERDQQAIQKQFSLKPLLQPFQR